MSSWEFALVATGVPALVGGVATCVILWRVPCAGRLPTWLAILGTLGVVVPVSTFVELPLVPRELSVSVSLMRWLSLVLAIGAILGANRAWESRRRAASGALFAGTTASLPLLACSAVLAAMP